MGQGVDSVDITRRRGVFLVKIKRKEVGLPSLRIKAIGALFAALSMMVSGCVRHGAAVHVVVFNYSSRPLANMVVGGQYVLGYLQEYGQGGTGGGIYCCIDVTPGRANVSWEYDRAPSDNRPDDYFKRNVAGVIPRPVDGGKYLGVHVYPDERVEFTLTRDIPSEKKEGEP